MLRQLSFPERRGLDKVACGQYEIETSSQESRAHWSDRLSSCCKRSIFNQYGLKKNESEKIHIIIHGAVIDMKTGGNGIVVMCK